MKFCWHHWREKKVFDTEVQNNIGKHLYYRSDILGLACTKCNKRKLEYIRKMALIPPGVTQEAIDWLNEEGRSAQVIPLHRVK